MTITQPIKEMIKEELRRNKNPNWIARNYSVSKRDVTKVQRGLYGEPVECNEETLEPGEIPEWLEQHVLQIRPSNKDSEMTEDVLKARQEFDDGLIFLCTRRVRRRGRQDLLVLFRIPRKQPLANPRPFFGHIYEG